MVLQPCILLAGNMLVLKMQAEMINGSAKGHLCILLDSNILILKLQDNNCK